ncbi:MAG: 8-oxo-dGTP diphosphatase [bacterium ADurb.Bin212]|nr:MAG: 8-oxo-dGTP diphosphatase [bacterium ADurb.Bin212]
MTKIPKIMTEALIVKDGKVLLGRRKKNGFGQGKWLGFGGKVELGETVEEAMTREFKEEAGIIVNNYEKRGVLTFHYVNDPDMEVHYYEVLTYEGGPTESDEMENAWFAIADIPYEEMWPNDRFWLPMFLKKEYFTGEFWFDKYYKITKHQINNM